MIIYEPTVRLESYERFGKVIGRMPSGNWIEFSSKEEYEIACYDEVGEIMEEACRYLITSLS